MKVSILIPNRDRHQQLARSLYMLSRQTYPCDVFVVDAAESKPGIEDLAKEFGAYYERIPPQGGRPGSGTPWRHAYYKTDHEFVIITHPEILVPFDAVERMLDQHESPRRSTPLLYFLNRPIMDMIESFPWREDLHSVQNTPDFRGVYNRWGLSNHQMAGWKHHVCFTGQTREDWDEHDFVPRSDASGALDDAFLAEVEAQLTEKTGTNHYVNQIDLTVYHQFHPMSVWSAPGNDLWHAQNYNYGSRPWYDPCSVRIQRIRDSVQPQ